MDFKVGNQPESPSVTNSEAEIDSSRLVEKNQFISNTPKLNEVVSDISTNNDIGAGNTELSDNSIEINKGIESEIEQKEDTTRKTVNYNEVKNIVFGNPQTNDFKSYAELFNNLVY